MILNNKRDELIWEGNSNGCYLVASRYNSLWSLKEKPPWAKAWLPGLTPKINMFFLLMLQDKIFTLDNLEKRGQYIPNRCILCKHQLESVNHIFIHCPYSMEVWDLLTKKYGVCWCKPSNVLDLFCQWDSMYKGTNLHAISSQTLPHFY